MFSLIWSYLTREKHIVVAHNIGITIYEAKITSIADWLKGYSKPPLLGIDASFVLVKWCIWSLEIESLTVRCSEYGIEDILYRIVGSELSFLGMSSTKEEEDQKQKAGGE